MLIIKENLKRFNQLLGLVVPNVHMAIVQRYQGPWLGRVQIDAFDAVRTRQEFPFDVQMKWHFNLIIYFLFLN